MKVGEGATLGVEACTEVALLTSRSVGVEVGEDAAVGVESTEVGVGLAVGGKGVKVGGMGVAEGVAAVTLSPLSPPG